MTDSRINLRRPWLAALLTFLVPGLGHAYQGRLFKAMLYFVCITGMFATGARMSDWRAVQAPPFDYRVNNRTLMRLKFAAQVGMGIPAIAAVIQAQRFLAASNQAPTRLSRPIVAPFDGVYSKLGKTSRGEATVHGTLRLETVEGVAGETIAGSFTGTTDAGAPISLTLERHVNLGRKIDSDAEREVSAGVEAEGDSRGGRLSGAIQRPIQDWLLVPLGEVEQSDLEGRLGKWLELALVLTWIAGLLNLLAIWDAFEGPAWGYDSQGEGSPPPIVAASLPPGPAVRESVASS